MNVLPIASPTRRRSFTILAAFVLAIVGFLLASSVVAGPATGAPAPFAGDGAWENNDADGSHQSMVIENQRRSSSILWFDDGATLCSTDPAFVVGAGKLDKSGDLQVKLDYSCVATPGAFGSGLSDTFSYNAGNDTLLADGGQCWYRAGTNSAICPALP